MTARLRGAAGARDDPCVRVAILPSAPQELSRAVLEGGGSQSDASEADAVIWTDAADPTGLAQTLSISPARWVQLPLAGVESFIAAGVVDSERIWTSAKGIYGPACAEQALALMLAAARLLHRHIVARRWVVPLSDPGVGSGPRRLRGGRVLIVGTGGIGRSLVHLLEPLDARVVAVNRAGRPIEGVKHTAPTRALPELLPGVDWVVLAAALTRETRRLFDQEMLARMRKAAWLINVARGGLVDTDALVEALDSGAIGGAALDVTEPEPLPDDHPLWKLDNVIITSHTANTLEMSLPELAQRVRRNVQAFAAGKPLEGRGRRLPRLLSAASCPAARYARWPPPHRRGRSRRALMPIARRLHCAGLAQLGQIHLGNHILLSHQSCGRPTAAITG